MMGDADQTTRFLVELRAEMTWEESDSTSTNVKDNEEAKIMPSNTAKASTATEEMAGRDLQEPAINSPEEFLMSCNTAS